MAKPIITLFLFITGFISLTVSAFPFTIFFPTFSCKFVCGKAQNIPSVLNGDYRTAINVHNFSGGTVEFIELAVESKSQSESPGEVSDQVGKTLDPFEAVDIDCKDILKILLELDESQANEFLKTSFIKGFLLIVSPLSSPPLVVEVVKTAGSKGSLNVESIDSEPCQRIQLPPTPAP